MLGITGANGRLGRLVIQELSRSPSAPPLRALTRDPAAARAAGAPNVAFERADFDDPEGLARALAGVDRLLLISTPDPNELRVRRQLGALEAARRAGVGHVIYLSFLVEDPVSPFPFAASHRATEEALRRGGARWTVLRPSLYLDALEMLAPEVSAARAFHAPAGDARASFVSRRDLARIAARVLAGGGHEGATYLLTGPEAVSYRDVAARLGRALGAEVQYVDVSEDEYRRRAGAALGPALEPFVQIWRTIREGWFERTSPDAARLAGAELTSVDAWLAERAPLFGAAPPPA
ncbi:MAG TPA: SDR family oxidoreductase [Polyangiaceae bacterium]|nr:SDR family oxidoreductase [Polyangiaceae bacterium]